VKRQPDVPSPTHGDEADAHYNDAPHLHAAAATGSRSASHSYASTPSRTAASIGSIAAGLDKVSSVLDRSHLRTLSHSWHQWRSGVMSRRFEVQLHEERERTAIREREVDAEHAKEKERDELEARRNALLAQQKEQEAEIHAHSQQYQQQETIMLEQQKYQQHHQSLLAQSNSTPQHQHQQQQQPPPQQQTPISTPQYGGQPPSPLYRPPPVMTGTPSPVYNEQRQPTSTMSYQGAPTSTPHDANSSYSRRARSSLPIALHTAMEAMSLTHISSSIQRISISCNSSSSSSSPLILLLRRAAAAAMHR
jgi:hypothetical protein